MIRLIMAVAIAGLLLPIDFPTQHANTDPIITNSASDVTAVDAMTAIQSVYKDASGFCERNIETCLTGQAFLYKVGQTFSIDTKVVKPDNARLPAG